MHSRIYIVALLFFPAFLIAQTHSGVWEKVSSEGFTPRRDFSTTVVDGQIYAIGGYETDSGSHFLTAFEIYDPITDLWKKPSVTGSFSGRYAHTADVVNSKIYVIGGNKQGTPLKEVEVFDISSNTWTPLSYSGTFHERFYHCASIVNDRIYLIGGEAYSNDTVSEVDVFDPASTSWSTLAATGSYTPRSEFSANIIDGKIYIIGGRTSNLELVESIEALDIASTTWIKLETSGPFISRYRHTAEVVDGKIYVIGGSTDTVNVFDPATNTWSIVETTGKFTKRTSLASAVVDGKIYAIGGHAPGAGELNTNEVFTPTKSDVDISEVNLSAISIFPNPSSDLVRITGLPDDTQTLRITDILGNPVLDVLNLQHTDVIVNVSKLSAGIYYIRIVSPGKATISKFVVQ